MLQYHDININKLKKTTNLKSVKQDYKSALPTSVAKTGIMAQVETSFNTTIEKAKKTNVSIVAIDYSCKLEQKYSSLQFLDLEQLEEELSSNPLTLLQVLNQMTNEEIVSPAANLCALENSTKYGKIYNYTQSLEAAKHFFKKGVWNHTTAIGLDDSGKIDAIKSVQDDVNKILSFTLIHINCVNKDNDISIRSYGNIDTELATFLPVATQNAMALLLKYGKDIYGAGFDTQILPLGFVIRKIRIKYKERVYKYKSLSYEYEDQLTDCYVLDWNESIYNQQKDLRTKTLTAPSTYGSNYRIHTLFTIDPFEFTNSNTAEDNIKAAQAKNADTLAIIKNHDKALYKTIKKSFSNVGLLTDEVSQYIKWYADIIKEITDKPEANIDRRKLLFIKATMLPDTRIVQGIKVGYR